jgi:hypothetical protein
LLNYRKHDGLLCRRYFGRPKNKTYSRVANLEATQTVVGILKRYAECCAMIGKFDGERIRVWSKDVGIPLMEGLRLAFGSGDGLDEELRSVTADNGEDAKNFSGNEQRIFATRKLAPNGIRGNFACCHLDV